MEPLYEHQISGALDLALSGKRILGDVPGLGKTRTLLHAVQLSGAKNPLVICPAIVRSHWEREAAEMYAAGLGPEYIVARSYEYVTRGSTALMRQLFGAKHPIDALVLDEAHYLKHAISQRTRLILGKNGYARRLPIVFAATGTPIPKHPGEIWNLLYSLFPEVLLDCGIPNRAEFMALFCVTRRFYVRGKTIEKVVGVKNAGALKQLLDTVMTRRTVADVGIDVPPLDWQVVTLDAKGDDTIDVPDHIRVAIERGDLDDIAADEHVARMRHRLGELKVEPVLKMVDDILKNSDEKIVLFAHHRSVLHALRAHFEIKMRISYIDGSCDNTARGTAIYEFESDPRRRVFIGQNQACGTGMDGLQHVANRAILVEPAWSAYENEQLGARISRIGQKSARCFIQMIALAGTLDESIVRQHHREVKMIGSVLNRAAA